MKTVFDKSTRDELISRINTLNEKSRAQWGKMDPGQMLKHCTLAEEMALGEKKYKQSFLGKLFGKIALKDILKDAPMKKNSPTISQVKVKGAGFNVAEEKQKLIRLISKYGHYSGDGFDHPFFGKLTKEQMGRWSYKHIDHHLRQFDA